jgi:hypothetical protein
MTRRNLTCIHEPFGDAFYFGPERLGTRYENDEKARQESGFADSTYQTILDRIDHESEEVSFARFFLVFVHLMWFWLAHVFVAISVMFDSLLAILVDALAANYMSCWLSLLRILLSGRRCPSCDGADKRMRPRKIDHAVQTTPFSITFRILTSPHGHQKLTEQNRASVSSSKTSLTTSSRRTRSRPASRLRCTSPSAVSAPTARMARPRVSLIRTPVS